MHGKQDRYYNNMVMMEEKLSVIIPVYNCMAWLERCLSSVLGQTYRNLEVIVIDDGSEDGSAKIIKEFESKDQRVKYFFQANQGVSSARNRGLDNATGDIVTFVDADDYIERDMYKKMLSVMKNKGADIVECSCRRVKPNGKTLWNIDLKGQTIVGKRQCARHYMVQKNVTNYVCNKVYKRGLWKGLSFPSLKYSEDYYVNAIVHTRSEKKIIVPYVLYNYVLYEGQATDEGHIGISNFDGAKAGRLIAEYFKNDRELRAYASYYSCEYAVRTAKQYLCRYPDQWRVVRKHIWADFLYCCFNIAPVKNIGIDVQSKRRQYMRFFFKGELDKGIFVQAVPELARKEKQHKKCSRLLKLMCRWTMNVNNGVKIADFLIMNGWKNVAVYGVGEVGKCLIAELTDSDICMQYAIDRRQVELDLPVYSPEDDLPMVDCVIVTAVMDFNEIKIDLMDRVHCNIVSIEDIIYRD